MLRFKLFGSPQILLDQQPLSIPRRKSRAIIFYLAARPQPATRERVLAIFWPEHERAAAQQVLRTTLHGLRKTLGSNLVVTNETIALAADIAVDSRSFEAELTTASTPQTLSLALARYQGPLLEDFSLPDSEPFERWQAAERERLNTLALRGFLSLAEQQEAQFNFPAALGTLIKASALDPLHEEIQQALMRVQYRSGDRAGAIRRYEQLREQLDQALGVPPLAETRALYDAIITDRLAELPAPVVVATPLPVATLEMPDELPFTGRAASLAQITAATSQGYLALLEGEAGIGKTRLAKVWQQATGGLALVGAAYELEQSLPYQPIIGLLRGLCQHTAITAGLDLPDMWRAEVARLVPELGDGRVQPTLPVDESRLWEGVRQLLIAVAKHSSLSLLLDDLHWADDATLALLGYLLRQPQPTGLYMLATTRPAKPRSRLATLLQTLSRNQRVRRIVLAPLTQAEVHSLALHLASDDATLAAWLDCAAEGNPYMLAELVRYARDNDWLHADGSIDRDALATATVVPQSIYTMIEARLTTLSPSARQTLDLGVAIGREFDYAVLARAANIDEAALLNALDELRALGVIRPVAGQQFRFDHSLTMEVAYREIGEPRHRLMHRQVGEALEQLHGDTQFAGVIAAHFAEGNQPERAARYAIIAGQEALKLAAWQEAIGFFSLALSGQTEAQQVTTLLALGAAYTNSGEAAQASETFRRALQLAERLGEAVAVHTARLGLAQTLIPQGRYAEVISTVQPLLGTSHAVDAEFFWGAALSVEGADLAEAAQHLRESARLLAADSSAHEAISLARVNFELAGIAAQQGDLLAAVELYSGVITLAQSGPATEINWYVLAHNNLAYHLHLLGDEAALPTAQQGIALAEERGALGILPYLYSTIGEIWLAAGEFTSAESVFSRGLALSEQLGMAERTAGITANLGRLALARGQTILAIHQLSTALAQAEVLGTRHLAAQIRIWLAPLLPPQQARATLAEAQSLAESGGRLRLLAEIERVSTEL